MPSWNKNKEGITRVYINVNWFELLNSAVEFSADFKSKEGKLICVFVVKLCKHISEIQVNTQVQQFTSFNLGL